MSDALIEIVEEITFTPQGGSRHVWRLPDGSVWREEAFDISPVMFLRRTAQSPLEAEADRIRQKASEAASLGDTNEFRRLTLLAECLWSADPVTRMADYIESQP